MNEVYARIDVSMAVRVACPDWRETVYWMAEQRLREQYGVMSWNIRCEEQEDTETWGIICMFYGKASPDAD